jgi:tetratricopeptide (TPR) repeat protein
MSYGYILSGNLEEAWKGIEILKNLAREEKKLAWEIQALFTEGYFYAEAGSLDKAQNAADELKKKIEEGINKYWMRLYYVLISKIELEQKNFAEAIEYAKKAIVFLPAEDNQIQLHAAFFDFLAEAYYMSGDLENARENYQKIQQMTWGRLNIGGSYTNSFYMMGKIHEQLGDKAKAIEYYEKALELWKEADTGIPEVEDAKKRLLALKS